MNSPNKILYEHLKDYPTSTEGFNDIGNRAVAAALCSEHMPEVSEESPQTQKPGFGTGRISVSVYASKQSGQQFFVAAVT